MIDPGDYYRDAISKYGTDYGAGQRPNRYLKTGYSTYDPSKWDAGYAGKNSDPIDNWLFGKEEVKSRLPLVSNDVLQQDRWLRNQAIEGLGRDVTGDYDKSIRQQFQTNTFPTIMSRLSSAGVMSSPDQSRLLAQAGAQFDMGLGADKQRMQQEHNAQMLRQFQVGSPQEFENRIQPETEGFMQQLPAMIASALASYFAGMPLNLTGNKPGQQQEQGSQIRPRTGYNFGGNQGWQSGLEAPSMYGHASVSNVDAIMNKLFAKRELY